MRILVLLCMLAGLLYVWCELCRIEADLRDMLAASKFKKAESQCKEHQAKGEPFEPNCEVEQILRHAVKLRRKAFLLRRNTDKLDYLLFKPIRMILRIFGKANTNRGSCKFVMSGANGEIKVVDKHLDVASCSCGKN
jgi:hypothetical protein